MYAYSFRNNIDSTEDVFGIQVHGTISVCLLKGW